MNMTSPKNRFHIFTLDNIGSAAVLAAAVMIVASEAFSAFTDSTGPSSAQLARHHPVENRAVVAGTQVSSPQEMPATPTIARPMIVAANR